MPSCSRDAASTDRACDCQYEGAHGEAKMGESIHITESLETGFTMLKLRISGTYLAGVAQDAEAKDDNAC